MNLSDKLKKLEELKESSEQTAKENMMLTDENAHLKLENKDLKEEVEVLQYEKSQLFEEIELQRKQNKHLTAINRILKAILFAGAFAIIVITGR